jgi:hypothetical protein
MGRKHIEFAQAYEVEKKHHSEGPLAGAVEQRQSEDDETGAFTSIVTFPAGWQGDWSGLERPFELFGLKGAGKLGGTQFDAGFYAYAPSGAEGATFTATIETQLLLMVEAVEPKRGGSVEIQNTNELKWADHGVEGVPPGLVIKLLRVDAENGDWTWIAAGPAGWQEDRAEIHPTVEEALMLSGDILLGHRGVMSPDRTTEREKGAGPGQAHRPLFDREPLLEGLQVRDELAELALRDDAAPVRHADDRTLADDAARADDLHDLSVAELLVEVPAGQRRDRLVGSARIRHAA